MSFSELWNNITIPGSARMGSQILFKDLFPESPSQITTPLSTRPIPLVVSDFQTPTQISQKNEGFPSFNIPMDALPTPAMHGDLYEMRKQALVWQQYLDSASAQQFQQTQPQFMPSTVLNPQAAHTPHFLTNQTMMPTTPTRYSTNKIVLLLLFFCCCFF